MLLYISRIIYYFIFNYYHIIVYCYCVIVTSDDYNDNKFKCSQLTFASDAWATSNDIGILIIFVASLLADTNVAIHWTNIFISQSHHYKPINISRVLQLNVKWQSATKHISFTAKQWSDVPYQLQKVKCCKFINILPKTTWLYSWETSQWKHLWNERMN